MFKKFGRWWYKRHGKPVDVVVTAKSGGSQVMSGTKTVKQGDLIITGMVSITKGKDDD